MPWGTRNAPTVGVEKRLFSLFMHLGGKQVLNDAEIQGPGVAQGARGAMQVVWQRQQSMQRGFSRHFPVFTSPVNPADTSLKRLFFHPPRR